MNANDKVANLLEKKETLGKKRDELILQVMEVDRKIEDICSEIIDFQVAVVLCQDLAQNKMRSSAN